MPFISEAASAIKIRFGFHDRSSESMPSIRSSPDLIKSSASKENLIQSSSVSTSAIRSICSDGDDHGIVVSAGPMSKSFDFCDDEPSFWKDHNVQVIIRIRPLSSSEVSLQGYSKCIRQDSNQTITWTGHPESRFTFDIVADENVSQEKLFKAAGVPMVENCVGGYNSCMFAYGQTGSGKTHTMLGDIEGGSRRYSVNCGMTPRVFEYLFHRIQKEREARRDEKLKFICKCSFLEIYNEQILDLLDPSSVNLQIREDIKKGVYVENLKELEVTSAWDVMQQLIQGAANRKVAATNMNRASSRSHSVFTCIIESKWESQGVTHHRFARLNLVDLAGSERQKSSGAEGERLKEATNINKSLSTLGLVIMNLVNISNGKSPHVPYRDSKLTFLLQDSLGGNSKTIIIANVSPSNCCSLETLSTLKFAQRAKFIKNNAVVNEDTSGDVLVMRMQIQQLKKEVSRLQGLVTGGADNPDNDTLSVSFPGSPGSFKWEGLQGSSFSPLTSDKRVSHKKDYEVALVGAFRREKDKDVALQALAAESQAAMQLAKQREDEIQGLKMRLRFREAGIKRLEAVAFGKISAETHLLKEKEEHLKEIEVLRGQVDRNQEVTRFAMENLRLKEEIRRLKSFCEEGEREMMNEQIKTLQNKLLEALDWKLMHSDSSTVQKGKLDEGSDVHSENDLLITSQGPGSPWRSSINEENEFLRMQAIQNQAEMDTVRKKLNSCLEEKEKMERHANELKKELEELRSSIAMREETEKLQIELPSLSTNAPNIDLDDQIELKTLVDAIAAASQREAEAHETAILLSKENDELRMKLKVLIEDNNKLIELYERAVAETSHENIDKAEKSQDNREGHTSNNRLMEIAHEKETEMKTVIENLEHQLVDLHEENERLMGLYEKAMQERDEFKRLFSSSDENRVQTKGKFDCPEKLVEMDKGDCDDCLVSNEPLIYSEAQDLMKEIGFSKLDVKNGECPELGKSTLSSKGIQIDPHVNEGLKSNEPPTSVEARRHLMEGNVGLKKAAISSLARMSIDEVSVSRLSAQDEPSQHWGDPRADAGNLIDAGSYFGMEVEPSMITVATAREDLNLAKMKLDGANEKLLSSASIVSVFGSLEKAFIDLDTLSREINAIEGGIVLKQQELQTLKVHFPETQERRALINKKLSALRYSLSSFSSSVSYFEQREVRATARVKASLSYLKHKKEELVSLQSLKDEIEADQRKTQQSEVETRNNLGRLKSKLEEENRRQETEKVLFAIDNVEKADVLSSQKDWHLGGKATELLKSEEEKTKLQTEIRHCREMLGIVRMEIEDLNTRLVKVESEMRAVEMEIEKGVKSVEEMEFGLQGVIREKEIVLEISDNGITEIENVIIEYQQSMFEADLTEAEIKVLEEELTSELRRKEELCTARDITTEKTTELLEGMRCHSCFLSEKMKEDLRNVQVSVLEARSLLDINSNDI